MLLDQIGLSQKNSSVVTRNPNTEIRNTQHEYRNTKHKTPKAQRGGARFGRKLLNTEPQTPNCKP